MTGISIDRLAASLGWYGKIPSSGDFVHRRFDPSLMNGWHRWISQGLLSLKGMSVADSAQTYLKAPIWNFVLPVMQDSHVVQMGCITPSRDRVGRLYPLLAVLPVSVDDFNKQLIDGSARFYQYLGSQLFSAVSYGCSIAQLEHAIQEARVCMTPMLARSARLQAASSGQGSAILDILNAGHENAPIEKINDEVSSWPGLGDYFNPYSHNSYWWTSQASGAGQRTLVHGGTLNVTLFNTLFANPSQIKTFVG
ncbi:MAG: type VI secretion system-associated protein TagF [Alcaligenaceae bacterium]|jgi:type VI secretion system protein ImpM|nr:type VI secretion system-associated protein TagF [Alcaligenaceae bacterium]